MTMTELEVLQAARANALDVLARIQKALEEEIRKTCPGPHAYAIHRDHRSAWCNACRRFKDGTKIDE